jgi:hypothetical protein
MGGSVWWLPAPLATVELATPQDTATLSSSPALATAGRPQLTEVAMNHTRRIRHPPSGPSRRASLLIAFAAPAVLWADPPLPPGWNKHLPRPAGPHPAVRFPPGWNKHPPLPVHSHTVVIGGLPGWQTTLMVVMAAVLTAAVVVVLTRPRQPHAAPQPAPGPLQPQPERRPPR